MHSEILRMKSFVSPSKEVRPDRHDILLDTTLLGDLVFGSTIEKVRHNTMIPLLIVRSGAGTATPWGA